MVETTNLNSKVTSHRVTFFGVGEELRLVERFRRVSPDMIDYQFTVHAPSWYAKPWTAAIPFWKSGERIVRVRVPRGELRDPEQPERRSRRGCQGRRQKETLLTSQGLPAKWKGRALTGLAPLPDAV